MLLVDAGELGEYASMLDQDGQLRRDEIPDLLVEAIGGKHIFHAGNMVYASRNPTTVENDSARVVYVRHRREAMCQGVPSREQLRAAMNDHGLLDQADVKQAEAMAAMLTRNCNAREKTRDAAQKVELDEEIARLQTQMAKLSLPETSILAQSAESLAERARLDFLTSVCTMAGDLLDEPVWPSWRAFQESSEIALIQAARQALMRVLGGLPNTIVRSLARSPHWAARWRSAKESGSPIFDGPSAGWTANQAALVYWSDFYDSVRSHPDCPVEEIIANDTALQDWINVQAAKQKKQTSQATTPGTRRMSPNTTYRMRV